MGDGGGRAWLWVRIAFVVFVLAWILGPSALRDSVPILVVFLIALGLEVNFLVGALRGGPARQPDRRPQEIDRQVVAVSFDANGVVANIERFGLERGRVVTLSRRVTDSGVTGVSLAGQLLGNLGNFNPAGIIGDDG